MTTPHPIRRPKLLILFNHVVEEPAVEAAGDSEHTQLDEFESAETTVLSSTELARLRSEPAAVAEAQSVERALVEAGYDCVRVNLEDDADRIAHAVVVHRPAAIINLVDHFYGETTQQGAVAGLYELYGYTYTFADALGLATCQERARTHLMLDDSDVPVPGYALVRDVNAIPDTSDLRYPLIVTQAFDDTYDYEGYRSAVTNRDSLESHIRELAVEYDMPLLVEEFIEGMRVHAHVVGNRVLEALPLVERAHSEASGKEELVLAQLDLDSVGRIRQLTRRAFRVMGCRDAAQVDFVVDQDGSINVIDVRALFDVGHGSPFHVAAEASELGYSGVMAKIAEAAVKRGVSDRHGEAAAAPTSSAAAPAPNEEPTNESAVTETIERS